MQTLHQELDLAPQRVTTQSRAVLRDVNADPVAAYADEVRALRQRVATLESELAATKAAQFAQAQPASVFTEASTPAVVAVSPSVQAVQNEVAAERVEAKPVASNPGFAQAWQAEEGDASFEERIAERAFFQASTVDEESRTWLLAD